MKRNYYISKNGQLKRKDNSLNLVVDGENNRYIPIENVDSIYAFGELDFNTKLINFLSQNGVNVHFFNYYGFYTGSFYPKEKLNSGMLFVEQVKNYIDNERRVNVAREILKAASFNIYRNLRYYNERGKNLSGEMKFIENLKKKFGI